MRRKQKLRKNYQGIRNFKISLLCLFIFLVFLFFFSLLAFLPFFQIKKIEIAGMRKISESEIQNHIFSCFPRQILFWQSESIFLPRINVCQETLLNRFPEISAVFIQRQFFDGLTVRVEERKEIALFCGEECFFLDEEGVVFQKGENSSLVKIFSQQNSPLLLGSPIINGDKIKAIVKAEEELRKEAKVDTVSITIKESESLVTFHTISGWEIYFNSDEDMDSQAFNVKIVLREKISPEKQSFLEYVDARFGNRIYFKYRNSPSIDSL